MTATNICNKVLRHSDLIPVKTEIRFFFFFRIKICNNKFIYHPLCTYFSFDDYISFVEGLYKLFMEFEVADVKLTDEITVEKVNLKSFQ